MSWLKHDWKDRKSEAESLLKKIRLGVVPEEELAEEFTDEILEVQECAHMYESIVKDHFKIYDGYEAENKHMFTIRGVKVNQDLTP